MRWFLIVMLWSTSVLAHPQHRSTAQVEVDRARGKLEIGLRVLPEQLDRALERWGRSDESDAVRTREQKITHYLQERFRITPKGREKAQKLVWVGGEEEHGELWLYFECALPPESVRLSNRVFFELEATQINVVRIRDGTKRRTVSQTAQSEPVVIRGLER